MNAPVGKMVFTIQTTATITELARKTLRDTAPAVAQHLCNRIATRAQGVFNQINSDPIELGWDAEQYSLRVTPGDLNKEVMALCEFRNGALKTFMFNT